MAQPPYFETLEIAGWMAATEGMRAPLKSYSRGDSVELGPWCERQSNFIFGTKDYDLAKRLCKAGPEHRKWMRQIQVWVKISMPLYWWSEFDTYKIGTSANSESTMHTLMKRKLSLDNFDTKYMSHSGKYNLQEEIDVLNRRIINYEQTMNEEDKEKYFIDTKSLLPASFIQTRYVNLNYEVLHNMYHQRKNHRLSLWSKEFVSWIHTLPYPEFITEEWND